MYTEHKAKHELETTANTVAMQKIALEEKLQEMERKLKRERQKRVEVRDFWRTFPVP